MFAWVAVVVLLAQDAEPADDTAVENAQERFHAAQARYDTHDYLGAIEAFTEAYDAALNIPDPGQRDLALSRLRYNLARAHVYAFDIDAEPEHLEIARNLLADYRANERALGRDPDVDTDVTGLEAELAQREREAGIDDRSSGGAQREDSARPRHRSQRIAGISLLSLAAPFAGLGVWGAVQGSRASEAFETVDTGAARRDAQWRGQTGNILLGVGTGLAAASAITGAVLLGVGLRGERREIALAPTPTGFTIVGRTRAERTRPKRRARPARPTPARRSSRTRTAKPRPKTATRRRTPTTVTRSRTPPRPSPRLATRCAATAWRRGRRSAMATTTRA